MADDEASLWDYRDNFRYDNPLDPDDPLRVELGNSRGEYARSRLLRSFGIDTAQKKLRQIPDNKYVLFGGHRGCGKSTELRLIADALNGSERFLVVFVDALQLLDIHNLQYTDMLLAQAHALIETLEEHNVDVEQVYLRKLEDWYKERIETSQDVQKLSAELKTGAKAESGLPFVGKLFASLTTAMRTDATYKQEVRNVVRDSFSVLAEAFNDLLAIVTDRIRELHIGRALIFVIDGTDRLGRKDAPDFFIRDIHQMRQVRTNVIYCAPISILTEEGQIGPNYDETPFRLPMIKLAEKGSSERIQASWDAMREFVSRRIPIENFDDPDTLDLLIEQSGGHLRDLLRLVSLTFQDLDAGPISRTVAEGAVKRLAGEYRRLIKDEDYPVIAKIDAAGADYAPVTDQTRRLLYDLLLLEYNAYWWQSHPVVRSLPQYTLAASQLTADDG